MSVRNVLICGTPISGNKGGAALVAGAVKAFRRQDPDLNFTLLSMNSAADHPHGRRYGVTVRAARLWQLPVAELMARLWKLVGLCGWKPQILLRASPVLREYQRADLILNMTGIGFHDFFGPAIVIKHALWLLPAFHLKKPVVAYSLSLGPFESRLNRALARHCLSRVHSLVVRGESSRDMVRKLGVKTPMRVAPDVGFLLSPVAAAELEPITSSEGLDNLPFPLIGVAVNRVIDRGPEAGEKSYPSVLARSLDYLAEKAGGTIVFIPHDVGDITMARAVATHMRKGTRTHLLSGDYTAEQLKAMIGRCHVLVASRYHSIVASLSMQVPTLVIGWSHKYHEVMSLFGQQGLVVNFEEATPALLENRIDRLCEQHSEIRQTLREKLAGVKTRAFEGAAFARASVKEFDSL